ncbi:TetR/AcrR family transcriptional regulator [Solirubrobacter soli]|uniref:TetR/AcrR family transcriptional regulator n=1 Tax=Solirubrobacter soli TaxID=363832 RepID=UPI00040844F0|nr:TetR/AcrR family transcriptional regulator [Solirubrobacter soli]
METRSYNAPARVASTKRTRAAILASAKYSFEEIGWARTTMPAIAGGAGVSLKTVEAHFGTKANVLAEVVAALGREIPDTDAGRDFAEATSAISALPAHARYATPLVARSAKLALAIDEAAPTDPKVGELAERLRRNHDYGANWAARIIMDKRGLAADMTVEEATRVFRFAIDPATYRTLTGELGLDDDGVQAWMLRYTRGMLLLRT